VPFDDLVPDGAGYARLSRPDNVVIAACGDRGEIEGRTHLDIRIGALVLGAVGLTLQTSVMLSEGTGVDAGKVLLRAASAGQGRVLSSYGSGKGHARLRWPMKTFRAHQLTDGPFAPVVVQHRSFGGQLFLELPAWFAPAPAPANTLL